MKVYRISQWTFLGICLLILSLPLSRHWRLFLKGEKATGTVTQFTMIVHEDMAGVKDIWYVSEVLFEANGITHKAYGPEDLEYKQGRTIPVIYHPADPSRYCLLTFSGLYLNNYMILPVVLFIVWTAFYLSFNSYSKNKSRSKSSEVAFSPYKARKKPASSGELKIRIK